MKNQPNNCVADANVLFITLDSLALTTAMNALTPKLNSFSDMRIGETHGSYTLPAHIAFFSHGNLPIPIDNKGNYLNLDRIWRSAPSRNRELTIGLMFDSANLLEFYRLRGYKVRGFGGVGFFNPQDRSNHLPSFFNSYSFVLDSESSTTKLDKVSLRFRSGQSSVLTYRIHELCEFVAQENDPWFAFCNVSETHFPYNIPGIESSELDFELLNEAWTYYPNKEHASCIIPSDHLASLKKMQVASLEWVDTAIGKVLESVAKNRPTLIVVTADHGEEFGEFGRFGHGHNSKSVFEVPLWVGTINP